MDNREQHAEHLWQPMHAARHYGARSSSNLSSCGAAHAAPQPPAPSQHARPAPATSPSLPAAAASCCHFGVSKVASTTNQPHQAGHVTSPASGWCHRPLPPPTPPHQASRAPRPPAAGGQGAPPSAQHHPARRPARAMQGQVAHGRHRLVQVWCGLGTASSQGHGCSEAGSRIAHLQESANRCTQPHVTQPHTLATAPPFPLPFPPAS